jgi:DNA-directed RNA polymerase subunit RPC12/RpoP
MARTTSPPEPPPKLAYLAEQAVGIDAECRDCRHRVVLGFEKFLARYGDVPFPDFARLMKCSACGSRRVDVRPAWSSRS